MITTALNSLPGRIVRFVGGFAIALWGFSFGLPSALFVQAIGITIGVFALADICMLSALGVGRRAPAAKPLERHA